MANSRATCALYSQAPLLLNLDECDVVPSTWWCNLGLWHRNEGAMPTFADACEGLARALGSAAEVSGAEVRRRDVNGLFENVVQHNPERFQGLWRFSELRRGIYIYTNIHMSPQNTIYIWDFGC